VVFGCFGVIAVGAQHAPSVLASGHLGGARLAAAVLALLLTTLSMRLIGAWHAPAAATTLVFAEGSYHATWHDVLLVLVAVALTVTLGALLSRARLTLTLESMSVRQFPVRGRPPPP
jgi:hypothetical protein